MDIRTSLISDLIDKRGSRRAFAKEIGIAPTSLQSILERGIGGAAYDTVIKICRALSIQPEQLDELAAQYEKSGNIDIDPIHKPSPILEGDWSEEELQNIMRYMEFIKSQRQ